MDQRQAPQYSTASPMETWVVLVALLKRASTARVLSGVVMQWAKMLALDLWCSTKPLETAVQRASASAGALMHEQKRGNSPEERAPSDKNGFSHAN